MERFKGRKLNELFLDTAVSGELSEYEDRECLCFEYCTAFGDPFCWSPGAGRNTRSVWIGIGFDDGMVKFILEQRSINDLETG